MSVYHISDLHLGHRNIIKWRGNFETLDEHDNFVTDAILGTVCKRDKLFIHGDLCFDRNKLDLVQKIVDSVDSCVLILGNHDNERNKAPTIFDYIDIFGKRIHSMLEYKGCWLTHAPLHPSELRGKYNIHGHSHSVNIEDERYYNVSIENVNYLPIEHTKLKEILQKD